ncbi:NAD(P)-dependent oxidoreductase [Pseudomonadota bacterium AL_CKDN230030165-1A_HGKHYDSX7]
MKSQRYVVVSTRALAPEVEARARELFDFRVAPDPGQAVLRASLRDAHAVIARDDLPEDLCAIAPGLIMVARHGVGLDVVPLAACTAHGVLVSNVPGGNARSVAEFAVMRMLMLARAQSRIDAAMREAGWEATRRQYSGQALDLHGRRAGILGYGAIAAALAPILHFGFGMEVWVSTRDPGLLPAWIVPATREALARECQFVLPCVALNAQTRGLVDAAFLKIMRPDAWLINVSRGEVIDQDALLARLRGGQLAGAALDVVRERCLEPDHPLLKLPNVLISPHLAGHTADANLRNGMSALDSLETMLRRGERPLLAVNADEAWPAAHARWQAGQ